MKVVSKIVIAGAFALITPLSVQAVLIDFDSHASWTGLGGIPIPNAAVVTNDYATQGVLFGRAGVSAGVAVVSNINTFSNPNGACGLDASGNQTSTCIGDIYFEFTAGGGAGTTNSVSFVVGDGGGDLDAWIIKVYDVVDTLLESRAVSSTANISQSFAHSGMHRFHIGWNSNLTSGYFFDDLSFDTPLASNVAEPTTLAVLGLGLAGIGFSRRKRLS